MATGFPAGAGMGLKDPVHPGSIIRHECIEASGMKVGEAADQLGVTRQTLSSVINERAAVTPEMALRLEQMGWSRAEVWLGMQGAYDLARVRRRGVVIPAMTSHRAG